MLIPILDGDATEAVEVMAILRDVVDGRLIVQMGDKAYSNVNNDPEFKDRFTRVIRELASVASKPASAPPPAPRVESRPEPAAVPAAPAVPAEAVEPPSLASLMQEPSPAPAAPPRAEFRPPAAASPPPMADGRMPGDLPSFRLSDNPLPKLKRFQKNDVQPVPEVNLAGAIEAYLQYRLQQTGIFPGRDIHIYPAPDGGVAITVDGRAYEAVGDVAEADVREFLSQTIQEWQERH